MVMIDTGPVTFFVAYTIGGYEVQYKRRRGGEWSRTTYDEEQNLVEPETPVDGSVIKEMAELV
jgi:hypothetical protein